MCTPHLICLNLTLQENPVQETTVENHPVPEPGKVSEEMPRDASGQANGGQVCLLTPLTLLVEGPVCFPRGELICRHCLVIFS